MNELFVSTIDMNHTLASNDVKNTPLFPTVTGVFVIYILSELLLSLLIILYINHNVTMFFSCTILHKHTTHTGNQFLLENLDATVGPKHNNFVGTLPQLNIFVVAIFLIIV